MDLFKSAMVDESLFPPRCCSQNMLLEATESFLPKELLEQYQEKVLEYNTSERTYCYMSICLKFIPPQYIQNNVATCKNCHCKTCAICKEPYHKNRDCADDKEEEELLKAAVEEKWQRCYSCRRIVELTTGCNHISKLTLWIIVGFYLANNLSACRCKAEFCYNCGAQWRQCDCPLWHEDRLVHERQNLLPVLPHQLPALPPVLPQPVPRRVERPVCRECAWEVLFGTYQCETCDDWLETFIFSCPRCGKSACRRCRYNRC